jgi:nitroreductase
MELYDAIRARRSVRSFEETEVPRQALDRILEAARQAPSAKNVMPWRFIVVGDAQTRAQIALSGVYGKFLATTPVVIVGCGDEAASPRWYAVDTAIALEHIALAAVAEGLGSCWVGSFDEALVKRLLGIPEGHRVVALLGLGYPRERLDLGRLATRLIHPSKGLDRIACEGSFGKPWTPIHP